MELYELFDIATDNLAPLPDLAPAAERIVRRRVVARSFSAVCGFALAIGAGTLALHARLDGPGTLGARPPCAALTPYAATPMSYARLPAHGASPVGPADGAGQAFTPAARSGSFPAQAAAQLGMLWPLACESVRWAGQQYAANSAARYQDYTVLTTTGDYPLILRFDQGPAGLTLRQPCGTGAPGVDACRTGFLTGGYPYTATVGNVTDELTFSVGTGYEVTVVVTGDPTAEITMSQLIAMGNAKPMRTLLSEASADQMVTTLASSAALGTTASPTP